MPRIAVLEKDRCTTTVAAVGCAYVNPSPAGMDYKYSSWVYA